jgi:PKD repeat protein
MKSIDRRFIGFFVLSFFIFTGFPISGALGQDNMGLYFDGTDDHVATDLDAQPSAMAETTWEAWVYPTRLHHSDKQTVLSIDDGGWDRSIIIARNSASFVAFTGQSDEWVAAGASLDEWQHIAVVYAADDIIFYKNGTPFHYGSPAEIKTTVNTFNIGRNPGYDEYFQGRVDEVRVWDRVLGREEILSRMHERLTGAEEGLAGYWPLDEGTGTETADESGNGHHGTLGGGTEWILSAAPVGGLRAFFDLSTDAGTPPLAVSYTDYSAGDPVSWSWDFGDGTTSDDPNPAHTFSTTGAYKVRLTVADAGGGTNTASHTVVVFGDGLENGLIANYPFNGNAKDESLFDADAVPEDPELIRDRFSKTDSAYDFDGENDRISTPVGDRFSTTPATLSAWINIQGPGTYNPRIVAVGPEGSYAQYYALLLQGTSDSRRLWFIYDGQSIYGQTLLSDNDGWHHVACTYDGATAKIYIDGQLDVETPLVRTPAGFSDAILQIGYSDNEGDFFDGAIDDVRIYNRALSASEIMQLHDFTFDPYAVFTTDVSEGIAPLSVSFQNHSTGDDIFNSWDFGDGATSTFLSPAHTYAEPGTYTAVLTVSNSAGETDRMEKTVHVYRTALDLGLVAHYPFNDGAADESRFSNNGAVEGAVPANSRFGTETALQFDGTDDAVVVPDDDSLNFTDAYTLSVWINIDNLAASNEHFIVSKYNYGGGQGYGMMVTSAGRLHFDFNGNQARFDTGFDIAENQWHHIVAVYDGTMLSCYVNGALQSEAERSGLKSSDNPLTIGRPSDNAHSSLRMSGRIDDIRLNNRAFDESEVQSLFEERRIVTENPDLFLMAQPETPAQIQFDILNEVGAAVSLNGIEFEAPDLSLETSLPLDLATGERKTLTAVFSPLDTAQYRQDNMSIQWQDGLESGSSEGELTAGIFLDDGSELAYVAEMALTAYEACRIADPDSICTRNNLGVIYRLLGETEMAEPLLVEALSDAINAKYGYGGIHMNMGVIRSDETQSAKADEFYDLAMTSIDEAASPMAPQIYYNRAWEAYGTGDMTGALVEVNKTLDHDATNDFLRAKALILKGAIGYAGSDVDAAIADFQAAEALDTDGPMGRMARENLAALGIGPGELSVTPAEGMAGTGVEGGPFTPSSWSYELSNVGQSTLTWSAEKTADWIDISPDGSTLAADASETAAVALNAAADDLAAGVHTDTIVFKDAAGGGPSFERTVTLTIAVPTGELSGDHQVTLADAILALKVLAGLDTTGAIRADYISTKADVRGEGKVTMADPVFILRTVADLK